MHPSHTLPWIKFGLTFSKGDLVGLGRYIVPPWAVGPTPTAKRPERKSDDDDGNLRTYSTARTDHTP